MDQYAGQVESDFQATDTQRQFRYKSGISDCTAGPKIKFSNQLNQSILPAFNGKTQRTKPCMIIGEQYETHRFPSASIGFIAPGDASTAICMACDTKLRLEGISEIVQKRLGVSAIEDVAFMRLEAGPHHDGVRFANGAEATLQALGPGLKAYLTDALLSPVRKTETVEAM
jgi:hypothetical protein